MTTAPAEQHAAAVRWFDSMRAKNAWGLKVKEQLILLGGIKPHVYRTWRKLALQGQTLELPPDPLERLSILLGIYKGFKTLAPDDRPNVAMQWFNTSNSASPFCGLSPRQYALDNGSIHSLYAIRRYLQSACFSE